MYEIFNGGLFMFNFFKTSYTLQIRQMKEPRSALYHQVSLQA